MLVSVCRQCLENFGHFGERQARKLSRRWCERRDFHLCSPINYFRPNSKIVDAADIRPKNCTIPPMCSTGSYEPLEQKFSVDEMCRMILRLQCKCSDPTHASSPIRIFYRSSWNMIESRELPQLLRLLKGFTRKELCHVHSLHIKSAGS